MSKQLTNYALWLAVLAIIFSAVALFKAPPVPTYKAGGTVENFTAYPYGLQLNNIAQNTANGTIGAGANQANFHNVGLGRKIYVDKVILETTGKATSTYNFYVATSSAATISNNYAVPVQQFILSQQIATSSSATTTTNVDISSSAGHSGLAGVTVNDGDYLNIIMEAQGAAPSCTSAQDAPAVQLCSSATSTDRGFNIPWQIFYHYIP